jgi:hypothetical protein
MIGLRALWVTAAILAGIVLLAQVAGAAARSGEAGGVAAAIRAAVSTDSAATATVSLPSAASTVAVEQSAKGQETAAAAIAAARERANENQVETDEDEATEPEAIIISNARNTPVSGTEGTRPGWGCGDINHEHTGPPGRPEATPPPGCTDTD